MADLGSLAIKRGAGNFRGITSNLYNYAAYIQKSFSANVLPLDSSAYNKVTIFLSKAVTGNTAPVTKKTISGTTKRLGLTEGGMLVRIFDRATGAIYAETVSDAEGSFNITLYSRAGQKFTAVGYDTDGVENASIADLIEPV